jgi:hypothetical protein
MAEQAKPRLEYARTGPSATNFRKKMTRLALMGLENGLGDAKVARLNGGANGPALIAQPCGGAPAEASPANTFDRHGRSP